MRWPTVILVFGAIVVGCAAYEAGNILGAAAGASLGWGVPTPWFTVITGSVAFVLLWLGSAVAVARLMGIVVGGMGVAFLLSAVWLLPPANELLKGAFVPSLPEGSGLLVVGLIGTTIVPYNLFLGSGLAQGQGLGELRFAMGTAIVLGGVISMAVLVVGAAVEGSFGLL